jgi:hypothetical protein
LYSREERNREGREGKFETESFLKREKKPRLTFSKIIITARRRPGQVHRQRVVVGRRETQVQHPVRRREVGGEGDAAAQVEGRSRHQAVKGAGGNCRVPEGDPRTAAFGGLAGA